MKKVVYKKYDQVKVSKGEYVFVILVVTLYSLLLLSSVLYGIFKIIEIW